MTPTNHKPRLRLVKVVVQAVLVRDDGEELTEHTLDPVAVSAREWPEFPDQLAERLKELEKDMQKIGQVPSP